MDSTQRDLESQYARFPGISEEDAQVAFVMDGIWAAIEQQFGVDPAHAPEWPEAAEFFAEAGLDVAQCATLSSVACSFAAIAYRQGREHGNKLPE